MTPRTAVEPASRERRRSAGAVPAVEVEGLTKTFRERRSWWETLRHPWSGRRKTVLRDVGFRVRPREVFGLLGPNGAGKTTLFKILATLVEPDAGRARVHGHDVVEDRGAVRETLAPVIADERSLYWRLSARQNLELFASLYDLPGSEADGRIRRLLDLVGLTDTGRQMVGEFSSGMKQRLLLARALLPEPDVLLLDEPTRSLDPLAAREFRDFLREEIVGREGCTLLLATHDSEEALGLCDRVAVLDRGRLLDVGRAGELADRYGEKRFRAEVRGLEPERLSWLAREGTVLDWELDPEGAGPGWSRLEMLLADGDAAPADALSALVGTGAEVRSFRPVPLALADLMQRIVDGDGEGEG